MSKRIALVLPNWVGDAVMATPAVRALREAYPDAELVGFGRTYIRGVFDGNPWLDRFVPLERGLRSLLVTALRWRGFDVAVLFPNSFRSGLFARLAGCRRR